MNLVNDVMSTNFEPMLKVKKKKEKKTEMLTVISYSTVNLEKRKHIEKPFDKGFFRLRFMNN